MVCGEGDSCRVEWGGVERFESQGSVELVVVAVLCGEPRVGAVRLSTLAGATLEGVASEMRAEEPGGI